MDYLEIAKHKGDITGIPTFKDLTSTCPACIRAI